MNKYLWLFVGVATLFAVLVLIVWSGLTIYFQASGYFFIWSLMLVVVTFLFSRPRYRFFYKALLSVIHKRQEISEENKKTLLHILYVVLVAITWVFLYSRELAINFVQALTFGIPSSILLAILWFSKFDEWIYTQEQAAFQVKPRKVPLVVLARYALSLGGTLTISLVSSLNFGGGPTILDAIAQAILMVVVLLPLALSLYGFKLTR